MSIWRAVRHETAGAWRPFKYDLRRRSAGDARPPAGADARTELRLRAAAGSRADVAAADVRTGPDTLAVRVDRARSGSEHEPERAGRAGRRTLRTAPEGADHAAAGPRGGHSA